MRTVLVTVQVLAMLKVSGSTFQNEALLPGMSLTLTTAATREDAEALAYMLEHAAQGFRTHAQAL